MRNFFLIYCFYEFRTQCCCALCSELRNTLVNKVVTICFICYTRKYVAAYRYIPMYKCMYVLMHVCMCCEYIEIN